jgi:hypothetical protein
MISVTHLGRCVTDLMFNEAAVFDEEGAGLREFFVLVFCFNKYTK